MPVRDRILELRRVKAGDLAPHESNPRLHPEAQRKAVEGSLATLGQVAPLLAYREGDRLKLFDGHLRAGLDPDQELTVALTDLTPAEARQALAILDPSAALAETNQAALDELLARMLADYDLGEISFDPRLEPLFGELLTVPDEPPEPVELEDLLTRADVPDALFPTDNEWQIPVLDLKRQADAVDLPVITWGSVARTSRMRGTWHFYTEDPRYAALWEDPSPVVNTGAPSAVEPNFSIYEQTPKAIALYRTYQKRWIGRWWQSKGLRLFVDLNVAEHAADLNMLGVPDGWKAYATRGYTERMDGTEREYRRACEKAGTEEILFLVYGGGKAVADLCGKRGWVHVMEHMDRVKLDATPAEA